MQGMRKNVSLGTSLLIIEANEAKSQRRRPPWIYLERSRMTLRSFEIGKLSCSRCSISMLNPSRLFAERTQKLNDELASLETDSISHPDYLSMVNAIESQRRERVALARTSFGFKVKALQNKSVAERTYYHSQYMQSVRDIRDTALERANQEWYQIQRGRRALDEGVAERTLLTSFKRSDLVAQQNAYNTEVSILSGMAKWVGFPAAPEVTGASQSEMDDDLRKMGVSERVAQC